jgi:hypothetical protein
MRKNSKSCMVSFAENEWHNSPCMQQGCLGNVVPFCHEHSRTCALPGCSGFAELCRPHATVRTCRTHVANAGKPMRWKRPSSPLELVHTWWLGCNARMYVTPRTPRPVLGSQTLYPNYVCRRLLPRRSCCRTRVSDSCRCYSATTGRGCPTRARRPAAAAWQRTGTRGAGGTAWAFVGGARAAARSTSALGRVNSKP